MDSAGKRITKPPVRLIDQVLQPEILTSSVVNMASNSSTSNATASTNTVTVSSGQPRATAPDETIQKMFAQLMAGQRSNEVGIRALRDDITNRFDQCLERWQAIETRTTKLEDDLVRSEHQIVKQNETIQHNASRITSLEDEVVNTRGDLCRLIQPQNLTPHKRSSSATTTHLKFDKGNAGRYVSRFSSIQGKHSTYIVNHESTM